MEENAETVYDEEVTDTSTEFEDSSAIIGFPSPEISMIESAASVFNEILDGTADFKEGSETQSIADWYSGPEKLYWEKVMNIEGKPFKIKSLTEFEPCFSQSDQPDRAVEARDMVLASIPHSGRENMYHQKLRRILRDFALEQIKETEGIDEEVPNEMCEEAAVALALPPLMSDFSRTHMPAVGTMMDKNLPEFTCLTPIDLVAVKRLHKKKHTKLPRTPAQKTQCRNNFFWFATARWPAFEEVKHFKITADLRSFQEVSAAEAIYIFRFTNVLAIRQGIDAFIAYFFPRFYLGIDGSEVNEVFASLQAALRHVRGTSRHPNKVGTGKKRRDMFVTAAQEWEYAAENDVDSPDTAPISSKRRRTEELILIPEYSVAQYPRSSEEPSSIVSGAVSYQFRNPREMDQDQETDQGSGNISPHVPEYVGSYDVGHYEEPRSPRSYGGASIGFGISRGESHGPINHRGGHKRTRMAAVKVVNIGSPNPTASGSQISEGESSGAEIRDSDLRHTEIQGYRDWFENDTDFGLEKLFGQGGGNHGSRPVENLDIENVLSGDEEATSRERPVRFHTMNIQHFDTAKTAREKAERGLEELPAAPDMRGVNGGEGKMEANSEQQGTQQSKEQQTASRLISHGGMDGENGGLADEVQAPKKPPSPPVGTPPLAVSAPPPQALGSSESKEQHVATSIISQGGMDAGGAVVANEVEEALTLQPPAEEDLGQAAKEPPPPPLCTRPLAEHAPPPQALGSSVEMVSEKAAEVDKEVEGSLSVTEGLKEPHPTQATPVQVAAKESKGTHLQAMEASGGMEGGVVAKEVEQVKQQPPAPKDLQGGPKEPHAPPQPTPFLEPHLTATTPPQASGGMKGENGGVVAKEVEQVLSASEQQPPAPENQRSPNSPVGPKEPPLPPQPTPVPEPHLVQNGAMKGENGGVVAKEVEQVLSASEQQPTAPENQRTPNSPVGPKEPPLPPQPTPVQEPHMVQNGAEVVKKDKEGPVTEPWGTELTGKSVMNYTVYSSQFMKQNEGGGEREKESSEWNPMWEIIPGVDDRRLGAAIHHAQTTGNYKEYGDLLKRAQPSQSFRRYSEEHKISSENVGQRYSLRSGHKTNSPVKMARSLGNTPPERPEIPRRITWQKKRKQSQEKEPDLDYLEAIGDSKRATEGPK